jgi:hypothetical protein
MAYRKRRRRARNNAPADDAVAAKSETTPAEPEADDRVPAGQSDLPPESADATDLKAVHKEAAERYEEAWEKERQNQSAAYDDLRFLSEEEAQWDGVALRQRRDEQRPVLTVNKCPQFVRQVTGDIRQLRPSIHVVPVDEKADDMVSTDVLPEMVRYIERRSDAKASYFSAADQMVAAGMGHCRVFTEYAAGTTANQEIGIMLIQDGIAVVWDPDAIHPTRKDANYCFVPVDMNRKAAELRWKNKSFDDPLTTHDSWQGWWTDDSVRVTEYWRKVPIERELAVYPSGQIVDLTDDEYDPQAEEDIGYEGDVPYEETDDYGPAQEDKPEKDEADYRQAEGERRCGNCTMFRAPSHCTTIQDPVRADMLCDYFEPLDLLGNLGENVIPFPVRPQLGPEMGPKRADAVAGGARIEKRDSYRIERFVMSATEILDGPDEWPGMHIPIIPFVGEEIKIGRQVVRRGIVRVLKDVQRLFNYAISADAEAVALQPKAPFKGTRVNFEKYLDQWETANTRNWPFLEYDPDPLNGGRPPEREPPPVASQGIKELLNVATQEMSAVTGIYPSSLGAPAQETSGKAIVARQREGDTGTFVYIESFGRSIERIGQIIVDLIPHIYDNERSLRVVGDDGKMSKIQINTPIVDPNGDGIATVLMNDLTTGSYQVSVEMGPSYSTKREEAREGIQTLMQALGPQSAPLLADLFVQGQDFPLADRIAKRMRLLLPPQVAQLEAAQSGEPPPPPQPPKPPTPEEQVQAQELELKKADLAGKAQLNASKLQLDQQKIQVELTKVNAELEKARLAAQTAVVTHAHSMHAQGMDMLDNAAQRQHDMAIATTPPPTDEQQQQQIDALIEAVSQLQQAVGQIAQMANGGGQPPMPPGPPPPPPGPPPPPPGAALGDLLAGMPAAPPPGAQAPGGPPVGPGGPIG